MCARLPFCHVIAAENRLRQDTSDHSANLSELFNLQEYTLIKLEVATVKPASFCVSLQPKTHLTPDLT
jgi:hypothetical protein